MFNILILVDSECTSNGILLEECKYVAKDKETKRFITEHFSVSKY